jgi:hypothetical protein
MKELVIFLLLLWSLILVNDDYKTKQKIKILQDSIVVIQKDLEFKCKIIKDYQSRL